MSQLGFEIRDGINASNNNGNTMKQRGRILYSILGSLIVINEGSKIIFAFSGVSENFRWLHSVLIPAAIIWIVWNLWQTGDKWLRWALAVRAFFGGLNTLLGIEFIKDSLNTIPPSEGKDFLFESTSTLFAVHTFHGFVFVVIGLTLFLSPSIRAFLETRSQDNGEKLSF